MICIRLSAKNQTRSNYDARTASPTLSQTQVLNCSSMLRCVMMCSHQSPMRKYFSSLSTLHALSPVSSPMRVVFISALLTAQIVSTSFNVVSDCFPFGCRTRSSRCYHQRAWRRCCPAFMDECPRSLDSLFPSLPAPIPPSPLNQVVSTLPVSGSSWRDCGGCGGGGPAA